jgi:hypothetical protein
MQQEEESGVGGGGTPMRTPTPPGAPDAKKVKKLLTKPGFVVANFEFDTAGPRTEFIETATYLHSQGLGVLLEDLDVVEHKAKKAQFDGEDFTQKQGSKTTFFVKLPTYEGPEVAAKFARAHMDAGIAPQVESTMFPPRIDVSEVHKMEGNKMLRLFNWYLTLAFHIGDLKLLKAEADINEAAKEASKFSNGKWDKLIAATDPASSAKVAAALAVLKSKPLLQAHHRVLYKLARQLAEKKNTAEDGERPPPPTEPEPASPPAAAANQ